jgi:hypothetical protein
LFQLFEQIQRQRGARRIDAQIVLQPLGKMDSPQTDALKAPTDRFAPAGLYYTLVDQFNNLLGA